MAQKKRPSRVRPKSPARIRKKKRTRKQRGHHHHELLGLGLLCAGLFLAFVTWLEGNGGIVGTTIADWLDALLGMARIGVPVVLVALGALMVARASLVEVKPFRTGLVLLSVGAMVLLSEERGGAVGSAFDAVFGRLIGGTGTFILGLFLCWAGALLLTGASLGAMLHRSAHVARETAVAARRTVGAVRYAPVEAPPPTSNGHLHHDPPVDGAQAYPDVVGDVPSAQPVLVDQLAEPLERRARPRARRGGAADPLRPAHERARRLPPSGPGRPAALEAARGPAAARPPSARPRRSSRRSPTSASRRRSSARSSGPRVTRYELQLAPGDEGRARSRRCKDDLAYALATTEIRILAPIPGKQAVGVEVPNLSPNIVTLGDIFDEVPSSSSPLSVWLGKDISGASVNADLARMPHILIAGTTGSGKSGCINTMLCSILLRATPDDVRHDPDRPEARRARPLRVDPAPAHARRLEPEAGRGGAHERRSPRWSAATSA